MAQVKFYADKFGEYSNRLFTFSVKDRKDAIGLLVHFAHKGNKIRTAFYNEAGQSSRLTVPTEETFSKAKERLPKWVR